MQITNNEENILEILSSTPDLPDADCWHVQIECTPDATAHARVGPANIEMFKMCLGCWIYNRSFWVMYCTECTVRTTYCTHFIVKSLQFQPLILLHNTAAIYQCTGRASFEDVPAAATMSSGCPCNKYWIILNWIISDTKIRRGIHGVNSTWI